MGVGSYREMIERQWKWLTSKRREGDFDVNGFFLEDNMRIFMDRYRLRQKSLMVSLAGFVGQYEARLEEERRNAVYKNDNILITR